MNRAAVLLEHFRHKALHRAGTDFFDRGTALEIVAQCRAETLPILGIDGYFITATTTQQPIEWSLDLSRTPQDYDAVLLFIEAGAALPLFYEFVFGGD